MPQYNIISNELINTYYPSTMFNRKVRKKINTNRMKF